MYTVLICDDQPDIVNALNIYLTPEGYRILTAASGTEALEIAKREEIHLILLDVMMIWCYHSPKARHSGV